MPAEQYKTGLGLLGVGTLRPRFPEPPKGLSFVVPEGYLLACPGDANVSRYVPLIYDPVRKDISKMARIKVDRAAIEKVDAIYRGIVDSGGAPFLFSMAGTGVYTAPVSRAKYTQAWRTFQDLLDEEYMKSVQILRSKGSKK